MEPVIGIFHERARADRAIERLISAGIATREINFLTPGVPNQPVGGPPTTETESPGVGKAIGGVTGGALGAAGGMSLGAAAASLLVPGVGPVIAVGLLGAALLGVGGAVGGAILGDALDEGMSEGVPVDELFVYEDALRQGHSVVIVIPENERSTEVAHKVMTEAGAETIDAARENWWLGLRNAEEEHYTGDDRPFATVEPSYRNGFEAALHPHTRGRAYEEVADNLMARYPKDYDDKAFRRGYDRGLSYSKDRIEKRKASA